jgi:hypothetical protein
LALAVVGHLTAPSIGPLEGVLVPGESRLGFLEVVSQCRGFGRLV